MSRGPSTRRRLLAGAFGVLALVAVIAGVTVLAGSGGEPVAAPAPPPASPGAPAELPPSVATPHTSAPGPEAAEPGQQPGTVRLPEGGTARLVRREVGADGALPIPQGLDEATWWGAKLGGTHGAALLSGHVNWAGKKGPFDQLWRVHQGQDVSVVDTNGGQWVYRVTAVLTLHKDDLPAQARSLFGQDGPHRLVLVTCGGDYVGGTEGYRDNRIVTAQLVSRP